MKWQSEWKKLISIVGVFLVCFFLPVESSRFQTSLFEAFYLVKWYAQEHVLLCLVPAFFIAGAIAVFVSQNAVMKYLGPKAPKILAYTVASISGTILAVCSCTVLPLFAGIYRMGAGLGPAVAFLYSGPAINVLAIVLTSAVLGLELGIARMVGAILFSIIIGLIMHWFFRNEELEKANTAAHIPEPETVRPLWQNAVFMAAMVSILVFANWARPATDSGIWFLIFSSKWILTGIFAASLAVMLVFWFNVNWWKTLFECPCNSVCLFVTTLSAAFICYWIHWIIHFDQHTKR